MTTDVPKPATVAEIMAATGLGRNQVYRPTREGRMPGTIIAGKIVVTRNQFEELLRTGIRPAGGSTATPDTHDGKGE